MSKNQVKIVSKAEVDQLNNVYYYNVNIVNNNSTNIQAVFNQTLGGNIVGDPQDYFLAISRFSIDGGQIPLLYLNDTTYYVVLKYGAFTSGAVAVLAPAGPVVPGFGVPIYSYQTFLDQMNIAYTTAFGILDGLSGGLPMGSTPPYFLFNDTTGIISMYAQAINYSEDAITPIKVFMNFDLYDLFLNFQVVPLGEGLPSKADIQIRVIDKYGSNSAPLDPTVPSGYLKMSQEGSNCTRFFEPQSIRFKTGRMGVQPEYVQTPNLTTSISPEIAGVGLPSDLILTDFIPAFNANDIIGWRQQLVYQPTFYRLIDLIGSKSNAIDVSIWWVSQNGVEHPFQIGPGRSATIKLAYLKKDLHLRSPIAK